MTIFELAKLLEERRLSDKRYLEFIKIPSLSTGLYVLPANAEDTQQPHTEDEIYYVISGKGFIQIGEEQHAVQTGSIVLVEAKVRHFFYDISEELVLLVFFAPAEYSKVS
jgi:mannose-6-phosphate isomerase-like protein (cupin superfamily)